MKDLKEGTEERVNGRKRGGENEAGTQESLGTRAEPPPSLGLGFLYLPRGATRLCLLPRLWFRVESHTRSGKCVLRVLNQGVLCQQHLLWDVTSL